MEKVPAEEVLAGVPKRFGRIRKEDARAGKRKIIAGKSTRNGNEKDKETPAPRGEQRNEQGSFSTQNNPTIKGPV